MNRQYLQIGNAVPAQLGTAIGQAVLTVAGVAGRQAQQSSFDYEQALVMAVKKLRASARNKRPSKYDRENEPTLF